MRPFWTLFHGTLTVSAPITGYQSYIDFVRPGIRAQLVQDWRSYERRNLFSAFVEDFDIQHPLPFCPGRLIHLNADSTVLELDSGLEKHLQNLSSLGMHRGFVEKFPEFARFVHVIGTDNDHTTDSHVSVNKTQLPSRRVPPEIASEPDSLISDDGGQPNQHLPDIASTYRISTAVSVPDSNLLPGPGTTQDPALTFTFDKTIVPADFTEEFQPNDNQSCRESVRTLSTSQDTAGLNEPRDFLSTDPFAQVVNQPSSSQKDGALGDFNPPLNLGYGYDSYQLDPSLTEWELPVPWSMQLDGSGLKDFLFSV